MFEKITYISDHGVNIKLKEGQVSNLMNLHLVLTEGTKNVICEVEYIEELLIKARFIGEIIDGRFYGGLISKPSVNAQIRMLDPKETLLITGVENPGNMSFGISPFYNNQRVYLDTNGLFSNHLTILGNSGSGKSYGTTKVIQSVFTNPNFRPYKASFLLFDNNGEYISAFQGLNQINPNYNFKVYSTNLRSEHEKISIPVWLLSVDDWANLLVAENFNQLTLIESMIKLTKIFSLSSEMNNKYKNHLMAKAMMSIMYSDKLPTAKRNEIFNIFNTCITQELNMDAIVQGAGYQRKFRDCFHIDANGVFTESILVTEYITSFINQELDTYETKEFNMFTVSDVEKALAFALVSDNWLNNPETYSDAIAIKVRLHEFAVSDNSKFFNYPQFITKEQYLSSLLINNGKKNQIVNFNLEDIDDQFAKTITKIYSRMFFEYAKALENRGSVPFNILVEEAHRYIKSGEDIELLGYNIFDRISKEGRKFGVLLTLISQRPVELSETVMSQCANFLIFKTTHPRDIDYITKMVPYITEEIVEKQKGLQPGYCLGFGTAFKVPIIIKMDIPNPVPNSQNVNVIKEWSMDNQ